MKTKYNQHISKLKREIDKIEDNRLKELLLELSKFNSKQLMILKRERLKAKLQASQTTRNLTLAEVGKMVDGLKNKEFIEGIRDRATGYYQTLKELKQKLKELEK